MSLLCELWRRFVASSNFLYQQNTSAKEVLMRTPVTIKLINCCHNFRVL